MYRWRFHRRGDLDLIAVPRFDGNRARKILHFEPDIFAGGEIPRDALLRNRRRRQNEDDENDWRNTFGDASKWAVVHHNRVCFQTLLPGDYSSANSFNNAILSLNAAFRI